MAFTSFYFRSGDSFHHFVELCLFSYPSPLDYSAPFFVKLLLLVLAGGFEYIALSFLLDISRAFVSLATWIIPVDSADAFAQRFRDGALAVCLALSFVFRARQSTRVKSGYRQDLTLRSIVAYLFWHNPAAVCHGILLLWSYYTGQPVMQIRTPRFFWILVAPTLELGQVQYEATNKHKDLKTIFMYALWSGVLNIVVKTGPSIIISITLFAQSCNYWASTKTLAAASLASQRPHHGVCHDLRANISGAENTISSLLLWLVRTGGMYFGVGMDLFVRLALEERGTSLYRDEVESGRRQFRLLTILPGSGNQLIRCSLTCHNTSDILSYTAVSYCWGGKTPTHKITVNGLPLPVTRSAFEALMALRSCYRTRTIWIDYICIDQTNERDQTRQIPYMTNIYQNAADVVVWLGQSKTGDLATALVNRMFLVNRLQKGSKVDYSYEITTEAARALKRMLKAPWFARVWVVQEVVRARHKVTIKYGRSSLSWERFSWFTQSLQMDVKQLNMLSNRIGYTGLSNVIAIQNVSLMRRFGLVKDGSLSLPFYLAAIFRSSCKFDATKPHDRIYSLLGLSKLSNVHLQPDYQISLRQLFIDLVQNTLSTAPTRYRLEFLTHAGSGYCPKVSHLPSWAPDWTVIVTSEPLMGTEGGTELLTSYAVAPILEDAAALANFGKVDDMEKSPRNSEVIRYRVNAVKEQMVAMLYNAAPTTEPHAVILPNDILELRGHRLSHVCALGREYPVLGSSDPMTGWEDWIANMDILSEWIDLVLEHCPQPPSRQGQSPISDLFFCLLQQGRSEIRLDYTFTAAAAPSLNAIPPALPLAFWDTLKQRIYKDPSFLPEAKNLCIALTQAFRRACGGRRLGICENGNIGLFLPGTQVGDCVCVFSGARLPFNIRLVEGNLGGDDSIFELIGPAYVEGIMQGILGVKELCIDIIRLR